MPNIGNNIRITNLKGENLIREITYLTKILNSLSSIESLTTIENKIWREIRIFQVSRVEPETYAGEAVREIRPLKSKRLDTYNESNRRMI